MTAGPRVHPHGRLSRILRHAAALPLLRKVRSTAYVERVVKAHYRGSACSRPLLYTVRELTGRRRVARYRPRGCSIDVHVRHNTSDGNILQEFAMSRLYDPPEPVDRELRALGRPPVIVDLGAHIGLFGAWFLSLYPDAELTGFEPDPGNFRLLANTAAHSRRNWTVIERAAWTEDATLRFAASADAESRVDLEGDTTVRAVDIFPYLNDADLVKMDIEGSEWRLLADPRFPGILARAIILEWHPAGCRSRDPAAEAERVLDAAGFTILTVEDAPPRVGMLWGWRQQSGPALRLASQMR